MRVFKTFRYFIIILLFLKKKHIMRPDLMKVFVSHVIESAGHCPHDEIPREVNSIIREWILTQESRIVAGIQSIL